MKNAYRQCIDLSGFWDFRFDHDNVGKQENWCNGFSNNFPIAVPASWNDQFAEERDFLGPAWYQTIFTVPLGWEDQKIFLRFGSVNYLTDVWINEELIGSHEGGHLPFEFEVTNNLQKGENIIVVRVDGNLSPDKVPPSGSSFVFPPSSFDFFPFCGIHRPVLLYSVPKKHLEDIFVITKIQDEEGILQVKVSLKNAGQDQIKFILKGDNKLLEKKVVEEGDLIETSLHVKNPNLWNPNNPFLYNLTVQLSKEEVIFDSYSLKIGIRTIEVKGDQLLLNGESIYLNGFGRHEDFPITGRGYVPAVIIKDYSLMKWIGANSFRTSHYPYSEQMIDLADRLGILIIDEIPAVGLTFDSKYIDRHLELCQQYMRELISRDKNHPSVIMWSMANEPKSSTRSNTFFRSIYDLAKNLDPSRLITLVNMMGVKDKAFEFCDLICINRYYGWYTEPGQITKGLENLSRELDKLYQIYKKPIILSEFGVGTIPGVHAQPPEMFSEEYQVEFLTRYISLLRTKDYVVGEHIWNLCDFKTGQSIRRMGGINYKGVFTRDRKPKMVAHELKRLWKGKD
ncbi:MAG: beta-glucuronidase [Candidatus Thorarchaeota archaeon]